MSNVLFYEEIILLQIIFHFHNFLLKKMVLVRSFPIPNECILKCI